MCGAYIGVDEYRSKFTVLSEKFASRPASPETSDASVRETGVWNHYL